MPTTVARAVSVQKMINTMRKEQQPHIPEAERSAGTGNLVWIDLEMTGLNPDRHVIIEAAVIITDGQLNEIAVGPHLVIHQPQQALDRMDEWCTAQHTASGLIAAVQTSDCTIEDAQQQILQTIAAYCKPQTALLAGNSVWQDRIFLKKYMPPIVDYLYYRLIDVTTVKELVHFWYPNNPHKEVEKQETHRALDDIRESIAELKHYRCNFFI